MKSNKDMERILASINKSLKTNITFGNAESLHMDRIPTGMPAFDQMLGGGLPRQSVVELFGYQSSGKTYLAQRAIAYAQSQGMSCGFIDAEYSYDPVWAELIGVDVENLVVSRPDTGEIALDILLALCEAEVDLVVLDSIAALLPTAEAAGGMDDQFMGVHARLMNKLFRKLPPVNKKTSVILINQIRAGIGGYIVRDALPGGKGQEFFSRIMVRVKRGETIRDEGFNIDARTEKNKTHMPNLTCSVPFYYSGQADEVAELFSVAIDVGIITRSGPKYSFGETSAVGRENFINLLKDDDDLLGKVKLEVEKEL